MCVDRFQKQFRTFIFGVVTKEACSVSNETEQLRVVFAICGEIYSITFSECKLPISEQHFADGCTHHFSAASFGE